MTSLEADFLAAMAEPDEQLGPGLTLERLITDPELGNFKPSPVQLALIRAADDAAIDGMLTDEEMLEHFGTVRLPGGRPSVLVVRSGVRCGKSLIAAFSLLLGILTADFSTVRPGELVRALIVTPALATSAGTFHHLVGSMRASKRLAKLFAKDPGSESCIIRRPDGHQVVVQLAAARASGLNIRSTWLAGIVFDEADFHRDEDGAVNLPANFDASTPRMLPGSQQWVPSSPWADEGPFHEMFVGSYGKPDGFRLAFHSSARAMNPTLDPVAEADMRARDPDKAAREYDGIPLAANATRFFPEDALLSAVSTSRELHLEPIPHWEHAAGTDLGFRKNSSTLAIARPNPESGVVELAWHEERRPVKGKPLKPSEVCRSFALTCKAYGAGSVWGDLHYVESAREHMAEHGVVYLDVDQTSAAIADVYTRFRTLLVERRVSLPNDPRLLEQLRRVTIRPMPGGRVQIRLPTQGTAHADMVVAVVLACVHADRPLGSGGLLELNEGMPVRRL